MSAGKVENGALAIRALERLQYHSDTFSRLALLNMRDGAELTLPVMRSVLNCRCSVIVCNDSWRTSEAAGSEHTANREAFQRWDILAAEGVARRTTSPLCPVLCATLDALSRGFHAAAFADRACEQTLTASFGAQGPWLCAPLRRAVGHREEVFALCLAADCRRGEFGELDCSVADILASVLAGALINAQTNDQLSKLNATLDERVEDQTERLRAAKIAAEAASRSKSEFLANMSHEIRTPMTAILGFAENMLDPAFDEGHRTEAIHTIQRNGQFLLGLINDILDLSKIEAGKMTFERRDCEPCRIVADVASLMRARAVAKGLRFDIEYIGAVPRIIQSDPTRLRQILINLIGNAIKFTKSGSIRLVTRFVAGPGDADKCSSAPAGTPAPRAPEPSLQFDVIDTGRGMTTEQVAKLFQPFMQADTSTTREFGGTGLGLTISKRFAEGLGGNIVVAETKLGVGSTIRATVTTGPLDGVKMIEGDISAAAPSSTAGGAAPVRRMVLRGCRILLAEDGRDNQRLMSLVLKNVGADVTIMENGKLALDAALAARDEGTPFDVILMDMQMPVMDGYEAVGRLRRKGYTGPIIALTANAMDGDRDKCITAGCDDYTTKPFDRKKLIEMIQERSAQTVVAPPVAT